MTDLTLWHYSRPALAERYLTVLKSGITVSTTIFAPRRMGKTTFLRKDLTPLAQKAGFIVAYADLWQTRHAPAAALIYGLEQALQPKTLGAKVMARLNTPVRGFKAGAEIAGAKVSGEVTLDTAQAEQSETALRINSLLGALCAKGPVLLLVDEAQELAKSKESELLATALRTAITLHQDKLRVVFTGSSRTQLANVFSDAKAPLYSSGVAITDFPLLGKDFVEFVRGKFKASSGIRDLPAAQTWEAFEALNRQPEPFLKCAFFMLLNPEATFEDALAHVREELTRQENHEGAWNALDLTQKTLVKLLASNPTLKPFSGEVVDELRQKIGIDSLRKTHVQRAMAKLTDASIVTKEPSGLYEFENPSFRDWVRTLGD